MIGYAKLWLSLKTGKRAVTALEYGLIAGLIVATIAVGFSLLVNGVQQKFEDLGNSVAASP